MHAHVSLEVTHHQAAKLDKILQHSMDSTQNYRTRAEKPKKWNQRHKRAPYSKSTKGDGKKRADAARGVLEQSCNGNAEREPETSTLNQQEIVEKQQNVKEGSFHSTTLKPSNNYMTL